MATIHISQAEAERDLAGLLERLNRETTFIIENDSEPVAMLQAVPKPGSIDECITQLESLEQAVQDDAFAADVEFAVAAHREPLDTSILD